MRFVAELKRMGTSAIIRLPYGTDIDDGRYSIEINEVGVTRSGLQNDYLWKLIREISKVENGNTSDSNCQAIYLNLLKMAAIKYVDLSVPKDSINTLLTIYKDFIVLREDDNNPNNYVVRALLGSSKMNTKEMSSLIETAIGYAEEVGIDTEPWLEQLNGKT